MQEKIDFRLFAALWNRVQGQSTPAIHFRMAGWLEDAWVNGKTHLLLQAFRSSGKSTIVGLFAAWLLYRQPDLRILVLAADLPLARKMVRNVKRIIERHPLTLHLRPDKLDQWGADRFTVQRDKELRDPSMLARGIAANMTGSRADVVICDDVEVPKTCETADKRRELRERLAEISFVLVPGGTQLYVGTPHSWYTIYADSPRTEIGETAPFLSGFERLYIPLLDDKGQSAWPERFRLELVGRMKQAAGQNKFRSQMMLEPVNIAEGRLDPALLQRYEQDLIYSLELGQLLIGGTRMISARAFWDPAFGRAGGDGSVLACVFTDEDGRYHLHRMEYLNSAHEDAEDEATRQCRAIAVLARALYLPSITLEINGIGRFLPNILRREIVRARVPCAVVELAHSRPKDVRILEALEAVLAAKMLHVHSSVYSTPFLTEMQEWRPGRSGGRDDGLDALAGAILQEPVRIRYGVGAGKRQNWQRGGTFHTAQTDFEV